MTHGDSPQDRARREGDGAARRVLLVAGAAVAGAVGLPAEVVGAGREAQLAALRLTPEVMLVDLGHDAGMAPVDLVRGLHQRRPAGGVILVLGRAGDTASLMALIEAGADDFLTPPLDRAETVARIAAARAARVRLERLSADSRRLAAFHAAPRLSGPDHLEPALQWLVRDARDARLPLSVVGVQMHLDEEGLVRHAPRLLRYLKTMLRDDDVLVRWADDHVVVLAPGTGHPQALALATRLHEAAAVGGAIDLPVSVQTATLRSDDTVESLLRRVLG